MTDYNHKSDFSVDGTISSSVQGKLIGTTQVMPTPSAELAGTTVQYIGPSAGSSYIPGYIYICQEETAGSGTYIWKANNPGVNVDVDSEVKDSPNLVRNSAVKSYVDTGLGTKVATSTKVNGHELSADVSVTASDVGLGSVKNTDDSATPEENGTKKFTTGGAYTELKKKADASATTTNGKSVISNVAGESGAVIYWLANDNTVKSALAVNDCKVGGPAAQIYAINPSAATPTGTKLNIRTTGIYYLKDKATPATEDANDEVATIGDLADKLDKDTSSTDAQSAYIVKYTAATGARTHTVMKIAPGITDGEKGLAQVDVVKNYIDTKFGDYVAKSTIINDCAHTDTDKPLAANQGKVLMDKIDNISSLGRYLSTWDCTTGLPGDNPGTLPYTYEAGDYYVISRVKDGTTTTKNYMPTGTAYTGAASTTEDTTADIKVNYVYKYSGATATVQWQLIKQEVKSTTFANIGGAPRDNTNLAAELDKKLDVLADASTGQPMRMPYYFEILPEAGKIVVKDYTVQMNNTQAKEVFTLDVPAMDGTNAGLYTASLANAKVSTTDYITEADIDALAWS